MPEEKHNHAVPALPPEPEPSVPGAEPEGGPAKRAEAFMGERMAQLRERTPDEAPESGAGTAGAETAGAKGAGDERVIRATATAAGPERLTPQRLPDDYRLNLVKAYRRRQRAQLEHEHPASAPKGIPSEGETETPVAGGEDVDSDIEAHLAPPPQPPQPAPHNNWAPIGPSVLRQGQGGVKPATSGRTTGIAVAPGGDRVYIAAANGGVWRSLDAGRTWTSLMDAFDLNPTHAASDSLACGAIALAPGATPETDRLYVGSGEGSGAAYFGVGP
ncbi:MAG: hypothetical protein JXB35_03640, partial [Anaerolineae bacterium]|nr:hypothetical protein [Anaerolineae bacterium]